jgi:hypothetical protein
LENTGSVRITIGFGEVELDEEEEEVGTGIDQ